MREVNVVTTSTVTATSTAATTTTALKTLPIFAWCNERLNCNQHLILSKKGNSSKAEICFCCHRRVSNIGECFLRMITMVTIMSLLGLSNPIRNVTAFIVSGVIPPPPPAAFSFSRTTPQRSSNNNNIVGTPRRGDSIMFAMASSPSSAAVAAHSTASIAVPLVLGSAAPPLAGLSLATAASGGGLTSNPVLNWILSTFVDQTMAEASSATDTAVIEGEVFSGLAHIALDLFTMVGPATVVVRVAALIGRVCAIAADYIPDHYMLPQELVFQIFMLGVAWIGLVKSVLPMVFSSIASNISIRDGKVYSMLFQPAGLSWRQYKALSVCALDWVTLANGDVVTTDEMDGTSNENDDDYIYWLYSGDVVVQSRNKTVATVTGMSAKGACGVAGRGMLGEVRLLRRMDLVTGIKSDKRNDEQKRYRTNTSTGRESALLSSYPRTTVKAGEAGAILLRIHAPNLKILMDTDPHFAASIRTMLFQGMQAKLAAQLESSISN